MVNAVAVVLVTVALGATSSLSAPLRPGKGKAAKAVPPKQDPVQTSLGFMPWEKNTNPGVVIARDLEGLEFEERDFDDFELDVRSLDDIELEARAKGGKKNKKTKKGVVPAPEAAAAPPVAKRAQKVGTGIKKGAAPSGIGAQKPGKLGDAKSAVSKVASATSKPPKARDLEAETLAIRAPLKVPGRGLRPVVPGTGPFKGGPPSTGPGILKRELIVTRAKIPGKAISKGVSMAGKVASKGGKILDKAGTISDVAGMASDVAKSAGINLPWKRDAEYEFEARDLSYDDVLEELD